MKPLYEANNNKKNEAIGRLITVSPKDEERFYLKLLLRKITGAKSFEDLKNFEGKTYATYKDTATAMGLIKDDREIEFIFEEAVTVMLPNQLRKFFAWFLLTKKIEAKKIWDKHRAFLEKILKITMKIEPCFIFKIYYLKITDIAENLDCQNHLRLMKECSTKKN